ncbi:chromate efflux transporter [Paraglaciecola aquimarina]|uniref:Chromate efflux transporter n=1 Tax=Paraglaciecola algarum TaxID=3050085 RepID=A0ABS9D4B2_9ALTE|nr:chromate efflux transporter [Paraglaciecola sp. G1-23]MCF2947282.1 chromate efflux transporter [Paraglaciecola sp. G1-23]
MNKYKMTFIVFGHFLLLGCISFGGPAAHIGYFQKTFVEKLTWLTNEEYANLISLSQILPGPGSSQIGFAIGLRKAGLLGAIAAFIGFTLPSFTIMYCLASMLDLNNSQPWVVGLVNGLKLLAVVVVFDAIQSMAKSFCKTKLSLAIAAISAAILITFSIAFLHIFILATAAIIGIINNQLYNSTPANSLSTSVINTGRFRIWPLITFCVFFAIALLANNFSTSLNVFSSFYQSGSLVFGGGHVVLPLLQASVGDSLTNEQFLFGYAAAQGVPGPMFSIATFMGFLMTPSSPFTGALLATAAIFLPGFLLVLSLHDVWQKLLNNCYFSGAAWGINASVVGLLIATFYHPILTSTVNDLLDIIYILVGLVCIKLFKLHILILIGLFSLIGLVGVLI